MKPGKIKKILEEFSDSLDGGLMAADLWNIDSGLSVAGINTNASYTAIFSRIIKNLKNAFTDLGFPELGKYIIVDLDADAFVIFLNIDSQHVLGMLLDKKYTTLGYLLNIAIDQVREKLSKELA